jgi:hypothetical protein
MDFIWRHRPEHPTNGIEWPITGLPRQRNP